MHQTSVACKSAIHDHLLYPPQNAVLGGILFSVCLKFRNSNSVHISRFLMYNLSSFCSILFKFQHTLTIRQHMFYRKIGAEGSVL